MEIPNLPPRMELAVQPTQREARLPPQGSSASPDTLRPVLAAEVPRLPAPIKGLGIAPLDLFQVGDNDETPPPPEPPRRSVMLAVQPALPPVAEATELADEPASPTPEAASSETAEHARMPDASPAAGLPQLIAVLENGAHQPRFDLRR